MKRILNEFEFDPEQLNTVKKLAEESGLCVETVKILYGRGIRDTESIKRFLHPSKSHFISPLKMQGMKEAVELINRARDEQWSVVVYGDYDADGICASTIMYNALKEYGVNVYVCVPERRDGYGLSEKNIDALFEEYCPELFITVDCGISCAEQVKYIQEQGADVIVTDHHELPENLPECICINPKFNDGYPYDNLCGAGVAFKVACALLGEDAYKYLDFATIATIADSVPLTGENRDIVSEGLKIINGNPAQCYANFLGKDGEINSTNIAFSIAPKINAAGRMGDAKSALSLFNAEDGKEIFELSAKLTEYNIERQKYCDEMYLSAKQMLAARGEIGNIIMLWNENWNTGFVGIVAARLAEEFCRPAILFVRGGEMLKGSARSIESINIFEALRACSAYITEFGGHAQAAGVNITVENFEKLYEALNEYLARHYTSSEFAPTVFINGKLSGEYSAKFAHELNMLEPFGVGNKRPLFMLEEGALAIRPTRAGSPHLSLKSDKIELMYFGGAKYSRLLESPAPKKFIFEYNVSSFRGKEYVKGFVRDLICDNDAGESVRDEFAMQYIDALSYPQSAKSVNDVTEEEIERLMTAGGFGTVFIGYDYAAARRFKGSENIDFELFPTVLKGCETKILLAPDHEIDLSGYKRVIFLDNTLGVRIPAVSGRTVEMYRGASVPAPVKRLSCKREDLLGIYAVISANAANIAGTTVTEIAEGGKSGYSKVQTQFALKVFEQLGLIRFDEGHIRVMRGVKSKLENSEIYRIISSITV